MPSPLLPQSRTMSPPPTRAGKSKTKRYLSQFRSNPSSTSTSSAYPLSGFTGPNVPRPIKRPKKILYLMGIFVLLYWFGIRHGLGQERLRTPLGFFLPGRKRTSSVRIDSHGMATLRTPTGKIRKKLEHPIYELMERAEEKWHGLLANQSSTLEQAVQQYRKRYTLDPPAGFDKWWEFVQRHNISIRDDYDQLMKDVLPHYALKPDEWKRRALALDGDDYSYTLRVDRKVGVRITGPRAASARPRHMQNLIGGFLEDLPGDFQMQITVSDHDTGSQVLGKDQRERAMELVKDGDHFHEAEIKHLESPKRNKAFGWFKACPMTSPANIRPFSENYTYSGDKKSFIIDHLPTMDFCEFPEWKKLHGAMAIDYDERSKSHIKPVMVLSKFPMDTSFQITPIEGYLNLTESDLESEGFWDEKKDNRMFWRGSTTGGWNTQYRDWRDSHRIRLHLKINGKKGDTSWEENESEIMVPDGLGGYAMKRRKDGVLSMAYADVKLSGQAMQCQEALCREVNDEIQFGARVPPDQSYAFKYALDVDGNGWSSRFHRLLSSASPVIKMTMFPEWHMEWLTPWYHYIPLKPDYSDLYDIMAFFVGPVDENGKVDTSLGHDHLARKIGEAGQRYALDHWSWRNMQAYTFRLLLEIQRLHASDRKAHSFRLPGERSPIV